ncbi:MAG: SDR family oxidoreductase, partial [Pirellulales bacterium]
MSGATGYVGGRLVPALLERGYRVRCLVREPRKLEERVWRSHPRVEVVRSDLTNPAELTNQIKGCVAAYYLIHSMVASGRSYAERDCKLARNFADAAAEAKIERIIYLGGLGEMGEGLSEHLRSRRELEQLLGSTGIPVTALRAAMIIGAGSASFEILRYLVERLPVMITPRWVQTESQPVAIEDVLYWLVESLEVSETSGRHLEIGGPDVLSYRRLMQMMAEELGLRRRLIIGVPVLTPRLSSAWISLITPVTYRIARPLADGLRNRVVIRDDTTQQLMPHEPLTVREAIRRAISITREGKVSTRWSAAGPIPGDPDWAGGKVFVDQRSIDINASPLAVFEAVCRVGGGHGWYAGDILWRIRGWMDQLIGGPGLRRGRRDPEKVEFGEALDFWRVVDLERGKLLQLHAEMKLPGTAQLEFSMQPEKDHHLTRLTMTARFRPRGLLGLLYWYAVVSLHHIVFGGML